MLNVKIDFKVMDIKVTEFSSTPPFKITGIHICSAGQHSCHGGLCKQGGGPYGLI